MLPFVFFTSEALPRMKFSVVQILERGIHYVLRLCHSFTGGGLLLPNDVIIHHQHSSCKYLMLLALYFVPNIKLVDEVI